MTVCDFDSVYHGFECLEGERAGAGAPGGHVFFPDHFLVGNSADKVHGGKFRIILGSDP